MANGWTVQVSADDGVDYVPFGPLGDAIPATFTATIQYDGAPVVMAVRAGFGGDKIVVESATVARTDGTSVTPRDMSALELGAVVQDVGGAAVQPGHGAHLGHRPDKRPDDDELELVAACYWFHYVTWGRPRQAVMGIWDLPRATANRWITKARERFDMPDGGAP
ncbi:hypothetical protein GCM10009676_10220 [Prauserella halophila]|uniref:Uncharacterized protein n=1 Tax=Prauserella halophila TaxID=185641 RepID=A0ABN1W0S7_9PSEU|nr:hypothetical protein [Prauserella halophila]